MSNTFKARANGPHPRRAGEWGRASLLLGGTLAVLALLTLQLNLQLFLSPPLWAREDLLNLHAAAVGGTIVLGGIGLASVAFGVCSLVLADRHGQPCALGWAGLLASVLALLLWAGALADLFAVVEFLMRRLGPPR